MPFIISRASGQISREQEIRLKTELGKAIELGPGKSEQYLLLGFQDKYHLWLRSDDSERLVFRHVMSLLVRDVSDFMTPTERGLPPDEGK